MEDKIIRMIYPVMVGGMPGSVEYGKFGPACHGKWASHTGYRSFAGMAYEMSYENALLLAEHQYEKHKAYEYLVWEESKEHGWRWVHEFGGCWEVRIPDYAYGWYVSDWLLENGFHLTHPKHPRNSHYAISQEAITKEQLNHMLAPLRVKGTRFEDESVLCYRLDLLNNTAQGDLF